MFLALQPFFLASVVPKQQKNGSLELVCVRSSRSFQRKARYIASFFLSREVRLIASFVLSRDSSYYKGPFVMSQDILYQDKNVKHFSQDVQTTNGDHKICNDRQKL